MACWLHCGYWHSFPTIELHLPLMFKILEYHGLFKEQRCSAKEFSKSNIQAMLVICLKEKQLSGGRLQAVSRNAFRQSMRQSMLLQWNTPARTASSASNLPPTVDNQMWKCGKTKAVIPFFPLGLPSLSLHAVLSLRRFCTALVALIHTCSGLWEWGNGPERAPIRTILETQLGTPSHRVNSLRVD